MEDRPPVTVLRLGHRPGRDDRITTHVGLTARALGARRVVYGPEAEGPRETVAGVTDRFGGPFEADVVDDPTDVLSDWDGPVVHLTMYGLPLAETIGEVRADGADRPVLVVVGAGKVPFEVYEAADYNVGVTNQPHSEIAALAVFLDRYFEGDRDREFEDADRRVVPTETGKRVEEVD